MKATPLLQKVCTSGHFVRHSTYTGALICNSSRGEKIRVLRRPPGPPSRSTRGGFGLFSLARFGDRESRTFSRCWLIFTEVRGRGVLRASALRSSKLGFLLTEPASSAGNLSVGSGHGSLLTMRLRLYYQRRFIRPRPVPGTGS